MSLSHEHVCMCGCAGAGRSGLVGLLSSYTPQSLANAGPWPRRHGSGQHAKPPGLFKPLRARNKCCIIVESSLFFQHYKHIFLIFFFLFLQIVVSRAVQTNFLLLVHYNRMGPQSYMQSLINQNIVM